MKNILIASILVFVVLGCSQTEPEIPAINNLTTEDILVNQADSIYRYTKGFPNNVQMAFALIKNGQVNYYGIKRIGDTLITIVNKDKAFEIGSITKVFTTTLLSHYVLNGDFSLNDKINKYYEFPFNDSLEFTFQELANHTSGLPSLPSNIKFQAIFNARNPYKKYNEEKLNDYLKNDISLNYAKGEKSSYSNLGMSLVSYTIRKYSAKTFEQLVKEQIFDKYGMVHSTSDKSKIADILIEGLDDKGRPTPNWEPGALIGAGGIYSTVEDLTKFAFAQFDSANAELALTRTKTFQENDYRDVGLGWFIVNRKSGDKWYWHNGGTGGYTSSMVIDVKKKNGVIILSNISAYHRSYRNIDNLCFALMKTL